MRVDARLLRLVLLTRVVGGAAVPLLVGLRRLHRRRRALQLVARRRQRAAVAVCVLHFVAEVVELLAHLAVRRLPPLELLSELLLLLQLLRRRRLRLLQRAPLHVDLLLRARHRRRRLLERRALRHFKQPRRRVFLVALVQAAVAAAALVALDRVRRPVLPRLLDRRIDGLRVGGLDAVLPLLVELGVRLVLARDEQHRAELVRVADAVVHEVVLDLDHLVHRRVVRVRPLLRNHLRRVAPRLILHVGDLHAVHQRPQRCTSVTAAFRHGRRHSEALHDVGVV